MRGPLLLLGKVVDGFLECRSLNVADIVHSEHFCVVTPHLERRAIGHGKRRRIPPLRAASLARPSEFVICPLMSEIPAFRYF